MGIEGKKSKNAQDTKYMSDDFQYNNKIMRGLTSFMKKIDMMNDTESKDN